jgi:hypothetical protein
MSPPLPGAGGTPIGADISVKMSGLPLKRAGSVLAGLVPAIHVGGRIARSSL